MTMPALSFGRRSTPPRLRPYAHLLVGTGLALVTLLLGQACTTHDVIGVPVGSVEVVPSNAEMTRGQETRFTATVRHENGSVISAAAVSWSTTAPSVLSVDADGRAVALLAGSAVVSASYQGVTGSSAVTVLQGPALVVSSTSVALFGEAGGAAPTPGVVQITNGGDGTLDALVATVEYPAGGAAGWLSPSLSGTTAPSSLTLTATSEGLEAGTYDATVRLQSNGGQATISVQLSLTADAPILRLTPSSTTFDVFLGGSPPDPITVVVTNGGGGDLGDLSTSNQYDGGADGWLSGSLAAASAPTELTVSVDPSGLAEGAYRGEIQVAAAAAVNSPQPVLVTLNVLSAPSFAVTETGGSTVVSESGTTDEVNVVLGVRPVSEVVFDVTSADVGEVTVSPSTLTFTPDNWSTPQTVRVKGVDDTVADGNQVTRVTVAVDAAGSDDAFDPLAPQAVSAITTDDEVAGFTLAETGGGTVVSEAGTKDTVTVVLTTQPTSDVVLTVAGADPGEAIVDVATLTFTQVNWSTPQRVTVTGVDDDLVDGDQVTALTVSVDDAASDDGYDPLPDQSLNVTTTDDDEVGFTIAESDGSTVVGESGTTDVFTVALTARPTSSVVFSVTASGADEVTVGPTSLTFTPTNWSTPQSVTVTGVDDNIVDGSQITTVTVSVDDAASDDAYDPLPDQTVQVTTTDDEVAGYTVSPTVLVVPETTPGNTRSFAVVLNARPNSDVVFTVKSANTDEATVSRASLTFTSNNWSTSQPVTVTAVDDHVDDGDQLVVVTVSVNDASSDDAYDPLADQTVQVTTTDDDDVGFTVAETGVGTEVSEAGTTDAFTVALDAQPASDVVLTVSSGDTGEATVSPSSLTFTPGDWSSPKTVTVTGVDDDVDDGNQVTAVTVSVNDAGSDDTFDPLPNQTVDVTTLDDDVAGFSVSVASLTVNETSPGQTATFTVVLDVQPTSDVVIDVSSNDTGEATAGPSALTFTSVSWSTPQTVTVTGVDEVTVDGDQMSTITVSVNGGSSDNTFDPVPDKTVSVTTVDDDVAGFSVSKSSVTVNETPPGQTATFTVALDAQPVSNVVIDLSSSDLGEATVGPTPLTFTAGNWSTPQTVTVTGVDDVLDDGDQVTTITLSVNDGSSANAFDPLPNQTVGVTTVDDEVAGFTVVESGGATQVSESGTTDQFTVVLDAQPASDVVLDVTSGDTGEASVDKALLTFTPINWGSPQTVTVTGADDAALDGDVVTAVTISVNDGSSDDAFDPLPDQTVDVTTTDDEVASFRVSGGPLSVNEVAPGNTATFDVLLGVQPTSNVVLSVTSGDEGEALVDPATLTFTSESWSTVQTVTVTGVDDPNIDGDMVSQVTVSVVDALSMDPFDALPDQTVEVTTVDNEVASFSVDPTSLTVSESGSSATFTVVLDGKPQDPVELVVTTGDAGEVTVSPSRLRFVPGQYASPQTVTVRGVDDGLVDGDQDVFVTVAVDDAASSDPFDGLSEQVAVTNTDNEIAGFTVAQTGGSTQVSESGTTDQITVVLGGQPETNVVFSVSSSDPGEAAVDKSTLTFTPSNWSSAQTITVTGVDDVIVDGSQSSTITVSVNDASSNDAFDPLPDQTVSVTTTDNDVAGFTVSETEGGTQVGESGTTDQFTVVLDAAPQSNVIFSVSSSDPGEASVDKATLTFTPGDWSSAQTVTVTGVDDVIVDGSQSSTITVSVVDANSNDAFDPLPDQTVSVTTTDNDVAGFTVSETDGSTQVSESGTTDQFTVVLDAAPQSNVIFSVTSSDPGEASVDKATLTFTPGDWSSAQTVTVTGVDDVIVDGSQSSTITVSVVDASSNDAFDPLPDQTVSVTTTDNDVTGLTSSDGPVDVVEDPASGGNGPSSASAGRM